MKTDAEFNREAALCQGDGTDALLTALYGESSARTIGKAVGGSQARMLFDAAAKIAEGTKIIEDQAAEMARLRGIIDSLAARCQQERIEAIQDDTYYTTEED